MLLLFEAVFLVCIVLIASAPGLLGIGPAIYALIGIAAFLGLAIFLVVAYSRRSARTQFPARIAIYPDRVAGAFDARGGGSPVVLTIPFSAVAAMSPGGYGGGKEHFWVPAAITAVYHFEVPDAVSAGQLLRGAPAPPGCAKRFYLSEANFPQVKAAFLRACPEARLGEYGVVWGPEA